MAVEDVAAAHARRQVALGRRTAEELGRLWAQVDPARISPSWRSLLTSALAKIGTSQATAAASAGNYVDDALDAQGLGSDAAGRVNPGAFAGIASDGRPLASLLEQPAVEALTRIKQGATPDQALKSGAFHLDLIARTQVADAGRAAVATAIAARPEVRGYVRMVVGKTCSRCLILAGRRYEWNAGFRRHPRCDCRHVPVGENVPGDIRTNPRAYFDSLSEAEQDATFGRAGATAIREGADMAQVVNARRGMQEATVFGRDVLITTEGTTSRGLAGNRLGARETTTKRAEDRYRRATRVRLMPEQIFKDAKDRDDAIRLLRQHGYITGRAPAKAAPAPVKAAPQPAPKKSMPANKAASPKPTFAQRVQAGVTERRTLGGGMSAKTELVTLADGRKAVYKKATDSLGVPAVDQQDAEELGALVARAVGVRAPDVYRPSPDEVYMDFMGGTVGAELDRELMDTLQRSDEGARLGLVDLLIGNGDRNSGNFLLDGDRLVAIDHGGAFQWYEGINDPGRPPVFSEDWTHPFVDGEDWKSNPLSARDVDQLRGRLNGLRPEFARRDRIDWFDGMMGRLAAIARYANGKGLL